LSTSIWVLKRALRKCAGDDGHAELARRAELQGIGLIAFGIAPPDRHSGLSLDLLGETLGDQLSRDLLRGALGEGGGWLQTQYRPLVGPVDQKVDESSATESSRKATFDSGYDEAGRDEREQPGRADRPFYFMLRTGDLRIHARRDRHDPVSCQKGEQMALRRGLANPRCEDSILERPSVMKLAPVSDPSAIFN
jgi:hypothetical protein